MLPSRVTYTPSQDLVQQRTAVKETLMDMGRQLVSVQPLADGQVGRSRLGNNVTSDLRQAQSAQTTQYVLHASEIIAPGSEIPHAEEKNPDHVIKQTQNHEPKNEIALAVIDCRSFFGQGGVTERARQLAQDGTCRLSDCQFDASLATGLKPRLERIDKFFAGARDYRVDSNNDHVVFRYVPGRKSTRDPAQRKVCFFCDWEAGARPYILSEKKPALQYTANVMPYVPDIHFLVATRKHENQEFRADVCGDVIDKVLEHNQARLDEHAAGAESQRPLSGYYSAMIGNSQPHHHWHLVQLTPPLLEFLNGPIDNKAEKTLLQASEDASEGGKGETHWVASQPLGMEGPNVLGQDCEPVRYFKGLLLTGEPSYLINQTQRITDHFNSPHTETGAARSKFNISIMPPMPGTTQARVFIFHRQIIECDEALTTQLFDGKTSLDPGANEFAGDWVMAARPKDGISEDQICRGLYTMVDAGRPHATQLQLDILFGEAARNIENL